MSETQQPVQHSSLEAIQAHRSSSRQQLQQSRCRRLLVGRPRAGGSCMMMTL
jgi:hypothetical protein